MHRIVLGGCFYHETAVTNTIIHSVTMKFPE